MSDDLAGIPIQVDPSMPPGVIEIRQGNRWAAFTDDELDDIAEAIECSTSMRPLARWIDEIDAECERRREAAS